MVIYDLTACSPVEFVPLDQYVAQQSEKQCRKHYSCYFWSFLKTVYNFL